jgi:hypothetical protein
VFPIEGHPTSFCGYYKFLPQNHDTMRIFICLYKDGLEVAQVKLSDTVTVPAWTSFTLPIPTYANADSARVFLSSFNSDGAMVIQGNSVLYVDNLSFDNLIGIGSEQIAKKTLFFLVPNPASDIVNVNISTNDEETELNIYSVTGKLVKSEMLIQNQQQINIGDLSNGVYLVEIKSQKVSEKQRLIIHK